MPRLLFVCPDNPVPAGGIKQIYRQVEVLNINSYDAYVLHGKKPFIVKWFEHQIPVLWDARVSDIDQSSKLSFKGKFKKLLKAILNLPELRNNRDKLSLKTDDIIVLPEFYGKALDNVFPNQPIVMYNQNCYYTFNGYNYNDRNTNSIYQQDRLIATMVASEDALNYLGLFLKGKMLLRIKYGIDHKVFSFNEEKKKQIAFMPRKLREDPIQVFNILNQRNVLNDWIVKPISGMSELEVAAVLKESAIFLSFNHREGFGMPPAEAMACGCIVVGYTGHGGNEIFNPEFSFPVPERNIQKYVNTLEGVIRDYNATPELLKEKGKKASEFVLKEYSMKEEEYSILKAWEEIFKKDFN